MIYDSDGKMYNNLVQCASENFISELTLKRAIEEHRKINGLYFSHAEIVYTGKNLHLVRSLEDDTVYKTQTYINRKKKGVKSR